MSLRARTRQTVLGLSYHAGGPRLWDRLRRGRTVILMYHGITARDHFDGIVNYWRYNVPARALERHLEYLRRCCHVLALRDFLAGQNLRHDRTNVVVTFDDGYESSYVRALPLLERYEVPAVFALATGFVSGREPLWNDVVEYAVSRCRRPSVEIDWSGERHRFQPTDFAGRFALYDWLMSRGVTVRQDQRPELLAAALAAMEVSATAADLFAYEDYRPLTAEQVGSMARSELFELASHSVHHVMLARTPPAQRRRELVESKAEVEAMAGMPCSLLCLPGGSYDDEVLREAAAAGYECVLTSDIGSVRPGSRVLNRIGIYHDARIWWFADAVHGPVQATARAARRALRRRLRKDQPQ